MWKRRPRRFAVRASTRRGRRVNPDHAHNDVNGVFLETLQLPKLRDLNEFSVNVKSVESMALRPARHIGVKTFARFH